MMAQVTTKGKFRPLLYNFFAFVRSTTYKAAKKYFCYPLLYGNGTCRGSKN